MTIQRCPLKKGAFGQAGWGIARGPTKEQKEQLSLTHTLHTNICAGTQTNTCAWTCTCRVHTQTHTVKLSLSIVAWGHIVCRETIDSTEADETAAHIETSYFLHCRGSTSYEALCRRVSKRNLNKI